MKTSRPQPRFDRRPLRRWVPVFLALLFPAPLTQAVALSPYHTWRSETFGTNAGVPSIAGNAGDPDFDTLANLVEYGLGLSALHSSSPPSMDASGDRMLIRFPRNTAANDVSLTVQRADSPGGPWTDIARSQWGAPFAALAAGVLATETGSAPAQVEVSDAAPASGASFLRVKAEQKPTERVCAILQGQSNAVDMFTNAAWFGGDAGYRSIFRRLVRDLTGIPTVDLYGDSVTPGQRTVVGGTYLYSGNASETAIWMKANLGEDPSTWPLSHVGLECDNYIRTKVRGNLGDAPLALLRVHSEFDSRHESAAAAHYLAANRNFVARMRDAAGVTARQMPVFYGQVPYSQGLRQAGVNAVRQSWAADVADPEMNARYAWGAVNDEAYFSDNIHMGLQACRQANARMAVAYARWLYDNGYSNTDLSSLPTTGPRVESFRRGPSANQIDITVKHDAGNDLVIPENVRLEGFVVVDPGSTPAPTATAVERVDANTLRVTLNKNLSSSTAITFDYLGLVPSPFSDKNFMYGRNRLVTDNYHLLDKPAHIATALANNYSATSTPAATSPLNFPLCRMAAPMTITP